MTDLIVDTHAHVYRNDEIRYPMIAKPYRPPIGTGDIEHLRRERESHSLHRIVLVQTGSAYKWDNRLLADTARENPDADAGDDHDGSRALLQRVHTLGGVICAHAISAGARHTAASVT